MRDASNAFSSAAQAIRASSLSHRGPISVGSDVDQKPIVLPVPLGLLGV